MKHQNLLFFSLPLIFLLGFMAGSYWQATVFRTAFPAIPQTTVTPTAPPSVTRPVSPAATEEEKLTQAMDDPDFRRVHDFLTREKPMQMNLDPPSQTSTKKE